MQPLLQYFKMLLNPGFGALLFALRTIVAGLLTLYLAFLFDLDQPKWSIMAVVIVSQPLGGMALARSFGQVIGTTMGAVVAVLIMAIFPQAPLAFIITLALWLALCTAGGTLLRYTSSQAFVLSGYTAVVVALLAVPDQDGTFLLAVTRVTETLLAVACVCVVSLLTARRHSYRRKRGRFPSSADAAIRRDQCAGRAAPTFVLRRATAAQCQWPGAVAGQSTGTTDLSADRFASPTRVVERALARRVTARHTGFTRRRTDLSR
jgi:uncharacterized membrane protein YccC